MFDHVVVPLDGTSLAEQALPQAVSLGRDRGAHLHLATVARSTGGEFSDLTPGVIDAPAAVASGYLDSVAVQLRGAGVADVSTARLTGEDVVEALEAHRAEVGAGLTVMCTHGRGAVERAWLGSIADGLVRTSPAPVLLVRAAPEGATSADLHAETRFGRVLIALDGSHFSRQAFGPASQLGGTDASYVLARVIPSSAVGDDGLPKARALAEAKLKLEAEAFIADGYSAETVVEFAPTVAEGVLDLASRREADVIVIATHGRSGVRRLVLGSVADKVVRGADRPVLVVRPRDI
jgi:nucleotide-binding universal stress UspA family protein